MTAENLVDMNLGFIQSLGYSAYLRSHYTTTEQTTSAERTKMEIEDKIQETIEFLATLDERSLKRVFEALSHHPTSKFWEAITYWR